jgi:hypothetical protein
LLTRKVSFFLSELKAEFSVPVEVRPHLGAAVAAGRADETRLDVGEPDLVGPAVAADRDRMAAAIVEQ